MSRDIQEVERFVAAHPTQALFRAIGIAALLFILSQFLEQGLVYLARIL